ncbi:hypothetical protein OG897_24440 [Streptomyces sp. NBC_00237]|uniref:hypothetical protein n=1 Tax=Streptomyces sp. NBC_00237 TaxID=2975687 RepID=UPI002255F663|nr:hypothetical protein [Streptomyces sp. NBC_00237]MCX5204591.1 hypothetical protein [Streptomyces sp. NBC_00237]
MAALRPLLTATAAGGLLAALWFVPSANATVEAADPPKQQTRQAQRNQQAPQAAHGPNADAAGSVSGSVSGSGSGSSSSSSKNAAGTSSPGSAADTSLALADTGSVDTTPYLIGGTAFLGLGAGFVTYSARRRGATHA